MPVLIASSACGPADIDAEFAAANRHILEHERGNGYWLWKPYFIVRALESLAPGDWLFYCDAGAHFVAPIDPLVEVCLRDGRDVIVFDLPYPERRWTKRDAFVLLDCDRPEFITSRQRLASFHLWRCSPAAIAFAREWLTAAQDERLLTDLPNQCGLPNHRGFQGHRHDQSLLSLLSKKYGLVAYRNPSQLGQRDEKLYDNSPYGQIIDTLVGSERPLATRICGSVRKTARFVSAWWQGMRPRGNKLPTAAEWKLRDRDAWPAQQAAALARRREQPCRGPLGDLPVPNLPCMLSRRSFVERRRSAGASPSHLPPLECSPVTVWHERRLFSPLSDGV